MDATGKSNVTFCLDDVALEAGRAYAAKRGVSLNKAVNQYFLGLAASDSPRVPVTKTERALYRYSAGQASLSETVEALEVNDGGVVLALMREMDLPLPVLEDAVAREQAQQALPRLTAALKRNRGDADEGPSTPSST